MRRFLQLHLLTFYPPSNPNRDDTDKPKTAIMGSHPRQRISSQALKRAWRTSEAFAKALDGHLAARTQRIGVDVEAHLLARGIATDRARTVARDVAGIFGKIKKEDDKAPTFTEQLAFISPEEKQAALALAERRAGGEDATDLKDLPDLILKAHDTAADIAMFGRMLADNPDFNREAAVSVAHAVTTHRVVVEDDFYTAVDDLKRPSEDAGAGFIGEAGFGSGVYYLYLVVDRALLIDNLGGDVALAKTAVAALVEAAATVGPGGKAKSYASYARTSFALAELGNGAPRTLASAFIRPVDRVDCGPPPNDLLDASITALTDTRAKFQRAYPDATDVGSMDLHAGAGSLTDVIAFAVEDLA